ncbi:Rep1 [Hyposoter didymator ichnovirus]|nr:Rep1 [Hyposoter didymator ichnovirus]
MHKLIKITEMTSSFASGTRRTELPLPHLGSNEKQVVLPLDMILYISRFTEFLDYKNFVRALWPDKEGSYDRDVQKKLWQLSTHRFTTLFINGKPIEIEYNFDPERTSDPVLINSDQLQPVFGRVQPPKNEQFMRVTTLKHFVETSIHLNECSRFQYASCPCREDIDNQTARAFLKPQMTTCKKHHYHHYCSHHVNYWLDKLVASILHVQQNGVFDKDVTEGFILFLDTKVYFRGSEMQIVDSLFYTPPVRSTRRFNDGINGNV